MARLRLRRHAPETSLDLVEGFFDSGYLATAFINDEKRGVVSYDEPIILVTDEKIETETLYPLLKSQHEKVAPSLS